MPPALYAAGLNRSAPKAFTASVAPDIEPEYVAWMVSKVTGRTSIVWFFADLEAQFDPPTALGE
jgi:hypothetical protein